MRQDATARGCIRNRLTWGLICIDLLASSFHSSRQGIVPYWLVHDGGRSGERRVRYIQWCVERRKYQRRDCKRPCDDYFFYTCWSTSTSINCDLAWKSCAPCQRLLALSFAPASLWLHSFIDPRRSFFFGWPTLMFSLFSPQICLPSILLFLSFSLPRTLAQNISDDQIQLVEQRLADGAKTRWARIKRWLYFSSFLKDHMQLGTRCKNPSSSRAQCTPLLCKRR